MDMDEDGCTCDLEQKKKILIFACSGASNVGQLANAAAIELARQGQGIFYCIAGIGAHLSGMLETARTADEIIAIDGCPASCVKSTLEHAGLPIHRHVIVTDLGIAKNHNFTLDEGALERLVWLVDYDVAVPVR
jgi:uncharacterized metal-binding protein